MLLRVLRKGRADTILRDVLSKNLRAVVGDRLTPLVFKGVKWERGGGLLKRSREPQWHMFQVAY